MSSIQKVLELQDMRIYIRSFINWKNCHPVANLIKDHHTISTNCLTNCIYDKLKPSVLLHELSFTEIHILAIKYDFLGCFGTPLILINVHDLEDEIERITEELFIEEEEEYEE